MNNRRGIRNRNSKFIKTINIKLVVPIFIAVIAICIGVLIYKNYEEKILAAKSNETSQNKQYLLFQDIEKASKAAASDENAVDTGAADTTIKITTVGDILCEDSVIKDGYNKDTGAYDFSNIFSDIAKYTSSSDLTLGLLETNFVDGGNYSGNGRYNSPKEFGQALKNIGISLLSTANNHSFDYGTAGVQSTISYLNSIGIDTFGTYASPDDAANNNVLMKDVKGIKLAFLAYTYGTNESIPGSDKYSVNVIDKDKMQSDIQKARDEGADYVFVDMHWGEVDSAVPTAEQKDLADFLFSSGADFILGSHPASLQPMEVRQNSMGKNVYISYSTGNFISASKYSYSNIEMVLNIEITKSGETGETYLSKVTYVPVYLQDKGSGAADRYKLLDIPAEINKYEGGSTNDIDAKTYNSLKQALSTIDKLIGKENK